MSEAGVRESSAPVRSLRWYDLITPQALGLGVPMILMIGLLLVAGMTGWFENFAGQIQVWLIRFTGLNLFLDFSNLLILGMALWILSRITDPTLPARFVLPSRKSAAIGVAA